MRLFPRSKAKRIVKKWYKRTGNIRAGHFMRLNGRYYYSVAIPARTIFYATDGNLYEIDQHGTRRIDNEKGNP